MTMFKPDRANTKLKYSANKRKLRVPAVKFPQNGFNQLKSKNFNFNKTFIKNGLSDYLVLLVISGLVGELLRDSVSNKEKLKSLSNNDFETEQTRHDDMPCKAIRKFRQYPIIKLFNTAGECYGITVLWYAYLFSKKDLISTLSPITNKTDPQSLTQEQLNVLNDLHLIQRTQHLNTHYLTEDGLNISCEKTYSALKSKIYLPSFLLLPGFISNSVRAQFQDCVKISLDNTNVLNSYLNESAKNLGKLIIVGLNGNRAAHVMGLVTLKKNDHTLIKFFDPNFGERTFESADDAGKCINRIINNHYRHMRYLKLVDRFNIENTPELAQEISPTLHRPSL